MEYEGDIKEDSVVVNLNGVLDISCSDYVRKFFLDTVVKTPLTLVDLLDGEQTAKKRGNKLERVNPSPQVLRILGLAQLNYYFIIRQS
jgi:anti-anti-sigma regulatory factor